MLPKNIPPLLSSNSFETTKTGDHGKEYEKKVCALQALLAVQSLENFEIRFNAGDGKIFDDLNVKYENSNGNFEEIFIQIKHAEEDSGPNKKNLSIETLLGTGKQNKFSMVKFFSCYVKENLRGKNLVLMTNRTIKFERAKNRERNEVFPLHCVFEHPKGSKKRVKIFFEEIHGENENLVTTKFGRNLKLSAGDENENFREFFVKEFFKSKSLKEDLENFKSFCSDFTFSCDQPNLDVVDCEIKNALKKFFNDEKEIEIAQSKVEELFKTNENFCETITKEKIKEIFSAIKSHSVLSKLVGISLNNFKEIEKFSFKSDFVESFKQKIESNFIILQTEEGLTFLGCKAVAQIFLDDDIKSGKILFMNLKSFNAQREKILKVKNDLKCLLIDAESYQLTPDLITKFLRIHSNSFKIIIVSSFEVSFESASIKILELSDDKKLITKFVESFQRELFEKYKINFQGSIVTMSEILGSIGSFIDAVNDEILSKILNENLSIGNELKSSENFYIERTFEEDTSPKLELNSEKLLQKMLDRKLILIHDVAGMGKSTEIIKLGTKIKEQHKNFWVLNIKLGTKKFSDIFIKWDKENLSDFFESFIKTDFEKKIFSELCDQQKVAILLDGFDEISPHNFSVALRIFFKKILLKNSGNIFIITSRTNVLKDLISEESKSLDYVQSSELKTEYWQKCSVYRLKAFDIDQQFTFLFKWISKDLNNRFKQSELENACKQLITWSLCLNDATSNFLGIPLQVQMLAEIYEHKVKECLAAGQNFPNVEIKMTRTELFQSFMDMKFGILQKKSELSSDFFRNLRKINISSLLINLSCEHLNRNKCGQYYNPHSGLREAGKKFTMTQSEQKVLVNFGLINFVENEPQFNHKIFPEFFIAERFKDIVFDKESSDVILYENCKVLDIVLLQTGTNQNILKFVEDFLHDDKQNLSKNGIKFVLAFFKNSPYAIQNYLLDLKNGLIYYNLFIMNCIKEKGSSELFYALDTSIETISHSGNCTNIKSMLAIMPFVLTEIFDILKCENVEKNCKKVFEIILKVIVAIFNNSAVDEAQVSLNLIKHCILFRSSMLSKEFVRRRLNATRQNIYSKYKESFIKFCHEIDQNIIATSVKNEPKYPSVVLLELFGCKEQLEVLEKWAIEQRSDLLKITNEEIENSKSEVLNLFTTNLLLFDTQAVIKSKFLNPKVLLNLAKEFVESFDDPKFPFLTSYEFENIKIFQKKIKKLDEIFSKHHKKEYTSLLNLWFQRAFKICKLWKHCPSNQNNSFPASIDVIVGTLVAFLAIGKQSFNNLDFEICSFLFFHSKSMESVLESYSKGMSKKFADSCNERASKLMPKVYKRARIESHNGNDCFFCNKNKNFL